MSLKFEPSSELLLITAKQLFLNRVLYLAVHCVPCSTPGPPHLTLFESTGLLTLDPQPLSLNPSLSTLNAQRSTLNAQLSTLNPQPSTLNSRPFTLNPRPSTFNPQPSTLNPQPCTLNQVPAWTDSCSWRCAAGYWRDGLTLNPQPFNLRRQLSSPSNP